MSDLPTLESHSSGRCRIEEHSVGVMPGLSRLFLEYCAGEAKATKYYAMPPGSESWRARPELPGHWAKLVEMLAEQNPATAGSAGAVALEALRNGAGVVVTGQQVGLFGGPLFTPFKAATALGRARAATTAGRPHAAIFWLATEDHDFAEINHVTFPGRRELRKLTYAKIPAASLPVGGVRMDDAITPLVDEAWELLGPGEAMEALAEAYRPGRSFGEAFRDFYRKAFAAQGLLVLDASSRALHGMGAPVLAAALEGADELHAALEARNRELVEAGYHAQVAVLPESSLLFLLDERTGARQALKRQAPKANEPQGLWLAGRQSYSTDELAGILQSAPERISPSALLRPVFQDYLLSTSLTIGGPAEMAYFAQSAVLFERILGRKTPAAPRFSATLIEPEIDAAMKRQGLTLEKIFGAAPDGLKQMLAERAMPQETRKKLASAGAALESELEPLLEWMRAQDAGLGRSAETAASKMRYQMGRLRRLAANFELQREGQIAREAETIGRAIYPGGGLQERLHGAAYYFARYGFGLAEELTELAGAAVQAGDATLGRGSGHTTIWL